MGKRGPKPREFTPVWSSELAYACGLMATNGCLYNDGRHMNLTSKDLDQIETFKQCLGLNNRIGWKASGTQKQKKYAQIQFGNAGLYRWLISIGITPRKSKTIGDIAIPDKYFWDYVRGEFDGDGSSYAYWDLRWRSSVSLYINFACASIAHLVWLNGTIERLLDVVGNIRPGSSVYKLEFSKQKAFILFHAMYYSDILPYLRRKKEKLDRQWAAVENAKQGKRISRIAETYSVLRIT